MSKTRTALFIGATVYTGGLFAALVFIKRMSDQIDSAFADLSFMYSDDEVLM